MDPVALVEQELPIPHIGSRRDWARDVLVRLLEGGYKVVPAEGGPAWSPDDPEPQADVA